MGRTRALVLAMGLGAAATPLMACGSDSTSGTENDGDAAAGGPSTGGSASGGTSNTGGAMASGGSGGATGTGGSPSTGGTLGSGGTATGGMAGSGGGNTDGGSFMTDGPPITASDLQWTWIDFPDSFCRDGSTAGIAVSLNSASTKVMIYLEGGGACFDALTCGTNPANTSGQTGEKTGGVFDRNNAANPVADWNFVYVPYCTGDVHAGTNENGSVGGVAGTQKFVGRRNLEAFLDRIVPTFTNATQVLLTGISAGGFGAAANADLVQRAFGVIPVTVIDDSGPPMSSQYIPTCLQAQWRTTWGLDGSILSDCGAACPNQDDFVLDFAKFLAQKYPNDMGGLIETTGDSVITLFYGYGTNNCTGSFLTPLSAQTFTEGLVDFRTTMQSVYPNFGTYYISGTQHTWLGGGSFYTESVNGTAMVDWFRDIVEGTAAAHVGP